jgi:hypothetical protein
LNILLRDKGLEEELVLWEDEVLEFICRCSATAVDGSINPLNGNVIIVATAALATANLSDPCFQPGEFELLI